MSNLSKIGTFICYDWNGRSLYCGSKIRKHSHIGNRHPTTNEIITKDSFGVISWSARWNDYVTNYSNIADEFCFYVFFDEKTLKSKMIEVQ